MRNRRLVIAIAALVWMCLPAPALADCQRTSVDDIPSQPVVFVGTVLETSSNGGAPPVTIVVEEVWAGEVGARVTVRGLSDEPGFTEDERFWVLEARYLVVPIVDGDTLRDSICTATAIWEPGLAAIRSLMPEPAQGAPSDVPVILVVTVVLVLAGLAAFVGYDWLLRRRRSSDGA